MTAPDGNKTANEPGVAVDVSTRRSVWARILSSREMGVLAALIVLVLIMALLKPEAFLSVANLFRLSRQIAFTAIVAIGVLFVILTSGVDLSLGSTVGVTSFACGFIVTMQVNGNFAGVEPILHHPVTGIVAGVLAGALIGAINGGIVAYVGVTPFIVTLGMLSMARSLVYVINNGRDILHTPVIYSDIANGAILYVPVPVVVLAVVAVLAHGVLNYTAFGRRIYAVGGNEEATRLSGIDVRRVKFMAYVVCSVLCSITGLLYVGRFRSAVADVGLGMELDAIAAAVIGGTSLMGGQGSVLGVVIGASIMGVVLNAITLLEIPGVAQGLIIGGIIVSAAIVDVIRGRRSAVR